MKKLLSIIFGIVFCVNVLFADDYLAVLDQAEKWINSTYKEGSIAQQRAKNILLQIDKSKDSNNEKIAKIKKTFPNAFNATISKQNHKTENKDELNRKKYHDAIKSLLEQDSQIAHEMKTETLDECIQSLSSCIDKARAIDFSSCPPVFQAAYIDVINARASYCRLLCDIKNYDKRYNSGEAFVESFFRGLCGDVTGMLNEARAEEQRLKTREDKLRTDMLNTYYEMLKIAAKYGVDVSKYK